MLSLSLSRLFVCGSEIFLRICLCVTRGKTRTHTHAQRSNTGRRLTKSRASLLVVVPLPCVGRTKIRNRTSFGVPRDLGTYPSYRWWDCGPWRTSAPHSTLTMRRTRSASPSWAYPFFSSWKSLVMTCLAFSQVLTIYLLLSIASKREQGQDAATLLEEADRLDRDPAAAPRPPSTRKSLRRVLSVTGSSSGSTAATTKTCVPQTVSPGLCSDEARTVQRPGQNKRDTCAFDLDETEVVFGVWHSLATEDRLQPLLETWGRRAQVVLLASSVGVRDSKLFQEGNAGSRPHLLGERSTAAQH